MEKGYKENFTVFSIGGQGFGEIIEEEQNSFSVALIEYVFKKD